MTIPFTLVAPEMKHDIYGILVLLYLSHNVFNVDAKCNPRTANNIKRWTKLALVYHNSFIPRPPTRTASIIHLQALPLQLYLGKCSNFIASSLYFSKLYSFSPSLISVSTATGKESGTGFCSALLQFHTASADSFDLFRVQ